MARVTVEFACYDCGKPTKKLVKTTQISRLGVYKSQPLCLECDRIRQKDIRGRNAEEMRELELKAMPPVKILSRKEIKAIAHTITEPCKTKKGTYYRV